MSSNHEAAVAAARAEARKRRAIWEAREADPVGALAVEPVEISRETFDARQLADVQALVIAGQVALDRAVIAEKVAELVDMASDRGLDDEELARVTDSVVSHLEARVASALEARVGKGADTVTPTDTFGRPVGTFRTFGGA